MGHLVEFGWNLKVWHFPVLPILHKVVLIFRYVKEFYSFGNKWKILSSTFLWYVFIVLNKLALIFESESMEY